MNCNHDERFKGVFFIRNGCLACHAERLSQKCEIQGRLIAAWRQLSIARGADGERLREHVHNIEAELAALEIPEPAKE